jgi:hypothetical protein
VLFGRRWTRLTQGDLHVVEPSPVDVHHAPDADVAVAWTNVGEAQLPRTVTVAPVPGSAAERRGWRRGCCGCPAPRSSSPLMISP